MDYEICQENGWGVGTRLRGDEGYGPTTIEITYISRQNLLAKVVETSSGHRVGTESAWTLTCREWTEVK